MGELMSILNKFIDKWTKKNNNPSYQNYNYLLDHHQPLWMKRHFKDFAKEAYMSNVIAHRCINIIASSAAHVEWKLYRNANHLISQHNILKLLNAPNPFHAGAEFFAKIYSYLLIDGNAYIRMVRVKDEVKELYVLRPDQVTISKNQLNLPVSYHYHTDGGMMRFPINMHNGRSDILHIRCFHPLEEHLGLSPIEAAAYSIDQHNQSSKWNQSLLQNGARPSGALIVNVNKGNNGTLSEEEFYRIKEQMENVYVGDANAGKPLLLEGGLEWKEMSMSNKDMDFMEAKHGAAREIALAFGVPPQLLGIPGDNTYSNMQEARLALWEETLIPLLDNIKDMLNHRFVSEFGNDLALDYNKDSISALSPRRQAIWDRVNQSDFMTINEKRLAVGLSSIENGDQL